MRSVRKLVYYCDFRPCKTYKLTPQSMVIHERHCTLNPDRVCRMPGCHNGNCPVCDFARARQAKWVGHTDWFDRSLKAEVEEWKQKIWDSAYGED